MRYDVIVVGGGMGGLTSAALLARAGKKVVVVEEEGLPGGHARAIYEGGRTHDSAVHLITRCGATGPFGRGVIDTLLRHLGVHDRVELLPVGNPFYTLQTPDLRVAVPTGRDAFIDAHARLFPDERDGLRRLVELSAQISNEVSTFPERPRLRDLLMARWRTPMLYQYRKATLQQILDRELRDPRLRAVYSALWSWLGSPPWRASFIVWADMMAQYIEGGAYYVRGGFQSLANAVVDALERAGGELIVGRRATKIVTREGRVRGVMLEAGEQLEAPEVISNVDPRTTFGELVSDEPAARRELRKINRLELSLSAVLAYLATRLDVAALGVAHESMYARSLDLRREWDAALAGEVPLLTVTIPTITDPSLAPAGQHVVMLAAAAPQRDRVSEPELAERMLATAEHVVPGLRDHVAAVVGAPAGQQQLALRRLEAIYGAAMTPSQIGVGRPGHDTPIHGLHLVGQGTRPGVGVPYVMESGIQVARELLGRSAAADQLPHFTTPVAAPA